MLEATQKPVGYFSSVRTEIEGILPGHLGSVLEIGCATGATMAWLRSIRSVSYAKGIEIAAEAAVQARSAFDDVVVGNIETIDIGSGILFDVIVVLDVLEHLADPWAALRMLGRSLKPNGVFIASIPNVAHWRSSYPLFFLGQWDYQQEGICDRTHLRFFTEKTARSLFENSGCVIDKIEYVKSYPNIFGVFGNNARWRWYSQKLLKPILPTRFANFQFLIRARKVD